MLSQSFSVEDFSCPVCWDIFADPLVLSCSHSICKACLREWWIRKGKKECPVCKKKSPMDDPPCNLLLKNLCEAFSPEKHQNIKPKEVVQEFLTHLEEKLYVFCKAKTDCELATEYIKVQTQDTEMEIKKQFKKIHQFLYEDEEARITAVREELRQKSQMMKQKIKSLERDISTLSKKVKVTEKKLRVERISVVQDYKAKVERDLLTLQKPQMVPGALIDTVKHVGNLIFKVWDKMKDVFSYSPVILDPNTAHPSCIVSLDLSETHKVRGQPLPDNPERFDLWHHVLGSESFNSGIHSWDVEVGENIRWSIGVKEESFQRKGESGGNFWRVMFADGGYTARCQPGCYTDLPVKGKLWKIRVELDWDRGKLTFSDPDIKTHIHTFCHTFTEALFPYVSNWESQPIMMSSKKISEMK